MAIETLFKYTGKKKGDEDFLINKLKKFNLRIDEYKFNNEIGIQYTIMFAGKYIWIDYFTENNSDYNFIIAKYSSNFNEKKEEIDAFVSEMLSLGFELTNDEDFEDDLEKKPEISVVSEKEMPFKTYLGKDYTQEEWKIFEEQEYQKYLEKRSGRRSVFLDDEETEKKNFSADNGKLKEIQYFVINEKQDKVPVYEFPSAMVAPFLFLENGAAVDIVKFDRNGWCEILSRDGRKGFIQGNFVKKND